ncbi:MAG: peptidylprolyl isomerase [Saprospiraceae bacterium]|nr:peptidylprolyl isomerase [Candidatus Vicinibacter affinis]MBP6172728.1 peptidylprolyl isomerase [Saprospiraceae bacterium]MBK7302131.1 peptidylprolyl isomerase [Candidatus Vicinibacter affinis]MBK7798080.1 peptidylprolyl isomerase [Candidatus Vicinibacter affinis]MBP6523063.1 peptidylprolyl isomerase [Saprospiraceae bacterium]
MKQILFGLLLVTLAFSCTSKKSGNFALIETSYGNMKVRLYDSTPKHKANFIKLVQEKFYDGTLFHRVINNFMIQGGDPDSKNASPGQPLGSGGPGYTIDAEIGKFHFKGALCAARQGDQVNPQKKSSGSQFYLVQGQTMDPAQIQMLAMQKGLNYSEADIKKYATLGGTPFLDGDYTVFGEVVEGIEVIDKIAAVQGDQMNRPQSDIKMTIKLVD